MFSEENYNFRMSITFEQKHPQRSDASQNGQKRKADKGNLGKLRKRTDFVS